MWHFGESEERKFLPALRHFSDHRFANKQRGCRSELPKGCRTMPRLSSVNPMAKFSFAVLLVEENTPPPGRQRRKTRNIQTTAGTNQRQVTNDGVLSGDRKSTTAQQLIRS